VSVLDRFMVHDVTLLAPTYTADRYGTQVADWSAPPTATFDERGWFTQTDTDEMAQGREGITDAFELTLPATSALTEDMRVRRLGADYEIRGSVRRAETPDGTHHVIAYLRKVTG
jgi:head-tail adaptor